MTTVILIVGDFNTHHSAWYLSSTDTRGTQLENMITGSNFGILNWDSPTRLPGNANLSSPDVSLASASLITYTNWQTKTKLGSDHLPILISVQMDLNINPIPHRTSFNLKKANGDRNRKVQKMRDCSAQKDILYQSTLKCSNDSSRLWWNWQFCKDLKIGVTPFSSIGLGRRTTTTTTTKPSLLMTLKYLPQNRLTSIPTDNLPHQSLADIPLPVRPE